MQGMFKGGGCPKHREVQGRIRIWGRSCRGEEMVQERWFEGQEGK